MAALPTITTAPTNPLRIAMPGAGMAFAVDGGGASGLSEIVPGSITQGALHASVQQVLQFNLTSAQILGMFATPVTLIAAPGSGKTIFVDYVSFIFTAGTAYASGGVVTIGYSGGAAVVNTIAAATIIGGSFSQVLTQGGSAITTLPNTAITISNATGAFTTGTGTAVLTIWYSVV